MSKKKVDQRVKKMAVNSEWTRNVLKSMGFAATDIVKDLMPNTSEFAKSTVNAVDMIKDIRGNMSSRQTFGKQFANIPQIKQTEKALKTIVNDIKSGNLYGSSDFDDDMDFGFGDEFGDDGGLEFIEDDGPSSQPQQTVLNTLPVAKMIHASTEATVNTMVAVADQQMAVETEKILLNRQMSDSIISGLASMNDNLATLVRFNAESTAKFHAASMKFYEDSIKIMEDYYKKKDDPLDLFGANDAFDAMGNLNIGGYFQHVKKNIADMKDSSVAGMAIDNLLDPEIFKMMMANPTKGMMQLVTKKLVPNMIKTSMKSLDEAFSAIMPAIIAKINSFEDHPELDKIFKIFGVKEKINYDVHLDRYEKGAVPWDGESKKALVEVIPTYLRRIESAITGEKERMFDYDKGEFIGVENAGKRYKDKLKEKEASGYTDTKFKLRDYILNQTHNLQEVEEFGKDLEIYLSEMTKKGSLIKAREIRERDLFNGDERRTDRLIDALKSLSPKEIAKMTINELNDSRKAAQKYVNEANENSNLSGANVLYNGSYYDKDGKVKFDASKEGGMFHAKDKFGLTQLDYLRDIRKALTHGIKVFPDNSIELGSNWNPNIDIMSREENENETYRQRQAEANRSTTTSTDEMESNVFGIDEENMNDIFRDVERRNRQRQGKYGGKIAGKIDNFTDKINSGIMKFLFGGGFDDEDDTISFDDEGSLREAIMNFFTGENEEGVSRASRFREGARRAGGILGDVGSNFMKGFQEFQTSLFGERALSNAGDTISKLTEKIKERMPKAFRDGLKSGLIRTAIGANVGGILGSLILPGGPLGAVVVGMGTSLLKQSETFQQWMFGDLDEEGNRTGGVIPKKLIDLYGEHAGTVKKGAVAGALASFFLPGGPILGAVTGIGAGLLTKSEAFQRFMFGDDLDNKSMMNGAIGKLIKSLSKDKDKAEANPELATFLGGAGLAAGIAQGVGLLPSMLLPGGPIMGAIFGLSAGIAASSEKFQKFFFGEKDEDGQRYGGLLTRMSNWFDTAVLSPIKIKMTEYNDRMYEFLHEKVLFPIQDALMPIKQLGINVLDDIKESFHSVTDPIVDTFREEVAKPLGKWMKKHFMDPITKAIRGTFKLIGKAIGSVLMSPIKMLTGLGNIADHLNERRALKEAKQNKREQLRELTREEGLKGLFKGIKNLKITDEERATILSTGKMSYRAEREKNQSEREAKLQAEMEERQAKRDELNKQFEEDMAFGKGSGWKWSSKRQKEKKEQQAKEKQAWMQEKATSETIEMNQRIKTIKDLMFDHLGIGDEQTNTLNSIKDLLYKLVTGKDPEPDFTPPTEGPRREAESNVEEVETVDAEIVSDGDHARVPGMNNSSRKGIFKSIIDALRGAGQSHEDGLEEVPHDGYVAELHEGEMVLPKSPARKMRDMFENNNMFSKMTNWFNKREDQEKQDRDDNALGLTDEEAARVKEVNDRKRYSEVSKQGADYIINKRKEELKEKEEKMWRTSLLDAIYAIGGKIGSGAEKSFDLFSKLKDALGNLPKTLGNILKGLGITGVLAGLTQLLGLQQFKDYSDKAEENNDSILDVYQGEHREERLDADGTYVYDNQLISAGQKMIRPGTMKALLKPERVLYDKLIQPAIENGGKVIEKSKKIGGKVVDYFNPNITKTGTTALGESYKFTMRKPDPTAGQKMMGKVLDTANSVKSKSKGLFDEFMSLCKKALQIVADKFTEKFPKLAPSKIVSSLDDVMGSLVKYADDIIKQFGKKIAVFIGDVALDVVPVVGQVTELCCTAYDVITGLTAGNAGNMFGVPASHVDGEMRIICSILQGLCKFSAMAVLWIFNEIATSFLGLDVIQMLARFIYKILPVNLGKKVDLSDQLSGVKIDNLSMQDALQQAGLTYLGVDALYEDRTTGKLKDLSKVKLEDLQGTGISSAELQELARHQYNLENGTQLDSAAWNDKTNKTFGAKIMDSEFGRRLRGITTAENLGLDSTANVTLMDRIMNDTATKGTGFMNLVGKVTGNEKLANATVKDNWLMKKYSEFRNNRYNNKMAKLEEEIAEKEAKGKDTTKLYKKLDKLKGKLGLSDTEYEELKTSKMPGDAGMGDGEEFDPDKQKIVEVFNEDGTLSHCITVPVKETTEVEGFSSTEILKPVAEYSSSKMQGIPQYDEKGNLVSYTSVDKRKTKTGGLFSKIASAVGGFFGVGSGSSSSSVTTDNSVDNSSSVTNNTGDTYNTTNEIDTTPFTPLTEAINSLVGINMEENVDEEGRAKTGGILKAITDPMGFLFKNLLNVGINVKEGITGEETDPETVNKAVNTFKILQNPLGYLYKLTKGYFDGDEESVKTVNTVKEKWNETKENAKNKWNETKENAKNKWDETKENVKNKWDETKENVTEKWNQGVELFKKGKNVVGTELKEYASNPIAYLLNTSGELAEKTYFGGKELIGKGVNWAKDKLQPVTDKIKSGVEFAKGKINDGMDIVKGHLKDKFGFMTEGIEEDDSAGTKAAKVVKNIYGAIDAKKDEIINNIKESFNKALENIGKAFKYLKEEFPKKVIEFKDKVINGFKDGVKKVGDWFVSLKEAIPKKIDEVKNYLRDGFNNMVNTIKTTITEKVDAIKEFFSKIDIKKTFEKKITEIKDAWGNFTGSFSRIFDDLKSHFKLPKLPEIKMPDLSVTWDNVKDFFKDFAKELMNGGSSGALSLNNIRPLKYRATDSDFITPPSTTNNNTTTNSRTNNKFVFYNQSDARWSDSKIGDRKMKDAGCGPTSLAMAISQLTGEQITPDTVAKLGQEHLPGYSKFSLFPSVAEKLNMNYTEGRDGRFILDNLQRGIPVILSGRTNAEGTPYTSEGHVVTATKVKDGRIFVNDPRGKEYSGLYPLNAILTGLNKGMVVSPSNRTDVSRLSSGQLENGWIGDEYSNEYKNELGAYGEVGEYSQLDEMSGKTGAGQITLADRVLSYARAFLNNTSKFSYSQPRRLQIDTNKSSSKGCGADCSSFVSHVLSRAGDVNIYGTTSQTFWDSVGTKVSEPQIGDVVCQQGHVGLYSGDGNYIHMSGRKAGIKESKAIQKGNQPHRGYKRVLKNPSQLVDPTVPNANTFLGTVVGTSSGQPVGGGTPAGPQASLDKALLIGDSLTEGIKPTFEGKYPNAKAMGKGGKWATHWLKSLDELPDASSVGTVIQWLGINGVHNNKVNLKDSQELLTKLKEKYPNVPIFNMDIFPTTEAYSYNGYTGEWWRGLSQEFNKEMSTWSSSNGVNQINATNGFIQSDGFLDPSKAVDGIHFNTEGYKGVLSNIESNLNTYNANKQGSVNTGGTVAAAPDMLGVFGKLGNIGTGMVASIFNGKDVVNDFLNGNTAAPTDGTTPTNGTNPDIGNITDTAQAVWTFFTGQGYTPEATAGIMGNMEAESGVDPTRIQSNGKGPAAGICQWESWRNKSMRWKGMADYAASKGKEWTDLQSQLEWLDMEMQGKDPSTLSYLKKRVGGFEEFKALTSVDKATTEFMKCFERPGVEHLDRRLKSANDFYNRLKGSSGNISANGDISAGMGFQMATSADPTGNAESQPEMMNGWAYYRQGDPQWQENINGKYIKPSGCGMASHAMMLTSMFGKKVTPVTVGKWARANNYWNNGMAWEMPPALASKLGLTMVDKETNVNGLPDSSLSKVKQHLKSGYPVILSGLSNSSSSYDTPFTSGGHIVFAVGVDGNDQVIINDPRGPHRTKAYTDSGILSKGIGLRGYWAFDKPEGAQLPSDWISGDFTGTPGAGTNPNTGTTPTDSTTAAAPSIDMLGAFGQLGNIATNYVSSIFNGKNMFQSQTGTTPTDGITPTPVSGSGNFPKYALNDQQLKGIANILQHEQPGLEGRMAEASLMANLVDKTGDEKATVDNLIKKATGGWFASGKSRFNNPGNPEQISIDAARTVLVEGKRTLPRYVDEHDCFSDLEWVKNNGTNIKKTDRSAYIPHQTKLKNIYGASGTFHSFPNSGSDPFYYTSDELRQKWGDDCYSPTEASTPSGDAGKGDGKTYWAKGFGDNKPAKVSYSKSHVSMSRGASSDDLVNARRNMERSIREIDRNMNVVNNTTNISNPGVNDTCVKILKVMLQELQSINMNTAETANNISNIEIVSANEPVYGTTAPAGKNRNNKNIKQSNQNTGYDIARRIASYK